MRGKQLGEVQTKRSDDFTEKKLNGVQQDGGNRGSHADVDHLADAAGGFVMPIGMRVRGGLQEEEKGKQRQRNNYRGGQPAAWPGPSWLLCASCGQTLPPRIGRNNSEKVPPHCYPEVDAAQDEKGYLCIEIASLLSKSNKDNGVAPPPHSNWSLMEPSTGAYPRRLLLRLW